MVAAGVDMDAMTTCVRCKFPTAKVDLASLENSGRAVASARCSLPKWCRSCVVNH